MANDSTDDDTTESRQPAAKTPLPKSEWDEPEADWFPIGRAVFRFGIADPDSSATGETPPTGANLFSVEAFEQSRKRQGGSIPKIANYEPTPPSLEELTKVLQKNTHAREVEIDQEACCFRFSFDVPGGGTSVYGGTPWVLLAMPRTPLPIDPRFEAEALFNKEGLVLSRRSEEEIRQGARQIKAAHETTGLVWRQFMLPAFGSSVANGRVRIYARVGSATESLRRLPSDFWPRLDVLDWQHGVARDPEGTIYYSIHAAGRSRAVSANQKTIVADETALIKLLADELLADSEMTKDQAIAICKSRKFRVSARRFQSHVWPRARKLAGLSELAPRGRKKKSSR